MMQPGEETLRDDLRSQHVNNGHELQRTHGMEGDGCFYSVAKSTHTNGLIRVKQKEEFPSRKGHLTPDRVGDFSLEGVTRINVLSNVMDSVDPS